MRAIDADLLINFVENRYEITWTANDYEGGIKDACVDIIEQINKMPTIESERKTGKWKLAEDGWYCTACELYPSFDCDPEEKGIPFCPNCGAEIER